MPSKESLRPVLEVNPRVIEAHTPRPRRARVFNRVDSHVAEVIPKLRRHLQAFGVRKLAAEVLTLCYGAHKLRGMPIVVHEQGSLENIIPRVALVPGRTLGLVARHLALQDVGRGAAGVYGEIDADLPLDQAGLMFVGEPRLLEEGWEEYARVDAVHEEEVELDLLGRALRARRVVRHRVDHLRRRLRQLRVRRRAVDPELARHVNHLLRRAHQDAVVDFVVVVPARGVAQLVVSPDGMEEVDDASRLLTAGAAQLILLLGAPEVHLQRVLVGGGLRKGLGDQGRLAKLDAEAQVDQRVHEAHEQPHQQVLGARVAREQEGVDHSLEAALRYLGFEEPQEVGVVLLGTEVLSENLRVRQRPNDIIVHWREWQLVQAVAVVM